MTNRTSLSSSAAPGALAPLAAAVVALLWALPAVAAPETPPAAGTSGAAITFYIFAVLTIGGAVLTIVLKHPVSAALALVFTLFCTGGIYLSLHATFLAAMQVLVYAGAIMVLFIFVVMSVGRDEQQLASTRGWFSKVVGGGVILFLWYCLLKVVLSPETWALIAFKPVEKVATDFGDVKSIGRLLFSEYLFPFEAISILLLVAIVGAVMVSRRRRAGAGAKGA